MPDKAQEAYDVIRQEFRRLRQGVTAEELQRAKIGLKSKLIMQSESTQARSAGIASDFAYWGRVRTLDEIRQRLEKITLQSVQDFLDANPFENFTVVTIGPKEIQP
jgi:predicted Zn-dependent peptidase